MRSSLDQLEIFDDNAHATACKSWAGAVEHQIIRIMALEVQLWSNFDQLSRSFNMSASIHFASIEGYWLLQSPDDQTVSILLLFLPILYLSISGLLRYGTVEE